MAERELDSADAVMGVEGMSSARIVLTAIPVPLLRREALRDQLSDRSANSWLDARMTEADARFTRERETNEALANLTNPWQWTEHARSWGKRRIPGGMAIRFSAVTDTPYIIEVFESGAVRLAADPVIAIIKDQYSEAHTKVFYTGYAMSFATVALAWFSEIAEQAGLRGTYGLGLHLAGLEGAIAEPTTQHGWTRLHVRDAATYRDTQYRQVFLATSADLAGPLTPLVDRLFGPLLRSLDYGDPLRAITV